VPGILKQPGAVVLIYSRIAQRKAAHAHQIMKREALSLEASASARLLPVSADTVQYGVQQQPRAVFS
jgi:hypothetical protein